MPAADDHQRPEPLDLMAEEVVRDPFTAYAEVREDAALGRAVPWRGMDPMWIVTRHADVQTVLSDRRFVTDAANVPGADVPGRLDQMRAVTDIPKECLKYLEANMATCDGADHLRLRKLVSRPFTARRVAALRPRVEQLAEELLDELPARVGEDGVVDLQKHFAYPLPIGVICELVGVPEEDRSQWRAWSADLASGIGPGSGATIRGLIHQAEDLIARRRTEPGDDLLSDLIRAQDEDGDRLGEVEMVNHVIGVIVAGHETTASLIANGIAALLTHPDQLELLRADPDLLPRAVHELMRWCGPALGTFPRYAVEDVPIGDGVIPKGEAVTAVVGAGNRDPRMYDDPDRLDITRGPGGGRETHLGFGAGRHYCLGAALARQEAEVAIGAVLRRFPELALAVEPADLPRGPNPGTWHLDALPMRL